VLTYVHALRAPVLEAVLPGATGVVGPTSDDGWTVAWLPDVEAISPVGDVIAIDEADDADIVLVVVASGVFSEWRWDVHDGPPEADLRDAAHALTSVLERAGREPELHDLLLNAHSASDVSFVLSHDFALPKPTIAETRSGVTLVRDDPVAARLRARVAARELGGVSFAPLDDGWSVIRAREGGAADDVLAYGLAAGGTSDSLTVYLWRGFDRATGCSVQRGGDLVASATWNSGWHDLERSRAAATDARSLVDDCGLPVGDRVALRSLLARDDTGDDALAVLTAVLGLPAEGLAVLDDRPGAPELVTLEPASWWHVVRAAAAESGPWIPARGVQLLLAGIAALLALVSVGMVVFGCAVIATGGEFVDQDGVHPSDWLVPIVFVVLAAFNAWGARRMFRTGRFF